jgi:uncharacterized membrane protein
VLVLIFVIFLVNFFTQTLTTLLRSNNQIGDDGAQHLAEVLRKKKVMTELIWSNTYSFYLFTQTIAVLTLHQNRIKDIGVQYLADALRSNEVPTKYYIHLFQIDSYYFRRHS